MGPLEQVALIGVHRAWKRGVEAQEFSSRPAPFWRHNERRLLVRLAEGEAFDEIVGEQRPGAFLAIAELLAYRGLIQARRSGLTITKAGFQEAEQRDLTNG